MKTILVGAAMALLFAGGALAQDSHYVNGYTRSDGTYVAPHMQTNPNATRNDNWSTQGNVNPYTGQEGTKPRDGEFRTWTTPSADPRSYYSNPAPYAPPRGQSSYGDAGPPQ